MKPPQTNEPITQKSSVAKTRYLSGISHELRTPLNVIMGYAQLLENQANDDDPHKDKYSIMRHNCEHLSHLIEGILEFSAIEAGKLKVQFETIDLYGLIKTITTMFKHQAEQKGLKFTSQIDSNLPKEVKTDHKRLQQILINLLTNAIKFTEHGRIEFNVSYRNQVATFSIKDTGRGIASEDLSRIFQPFERIEQINNPIKGTGLGLPITQLLVDLLGGELTVISKPEKGSEFMVRLMLAPLTHQQSHAFNLNADSEVDHQKFNKHNNQSQHILVVDDEQSHREMMSEILSSHQFKLSLAAGAEQAKSLTSNNNFSLAIIDVSMPDINGWQLATWFKQHSPETKIMMLSANPRDTESSSDLDYDVYLTKPIIIDVLFNHINQLLQLGVQNKPTSIDTKNHTESIILSSKHQAALLNMLEIGHVNGIELYLKKLLLDQIITDVQYQQLTQPLQHMNLTTFRDIISHED